MPTWSDIFKIWSFALEPDPVTRRERTKSIEGAGVTDANAIPDIRSDGSYLSGNRGSVIRLRDSTDFIDLSSVTNRQSRYKEYERLRTVPEIETALTVFADESCVTGDTLIATPFGYFKIKELAKEKEPDEEFLVYCYDFDKEDYSLGWAYHPRLVKTAPTIKVVLDNGTSFSCTPDHRILLREGKWIEAGNLKEQDELMPFYRLRADYQLTKNKSRQFARIFTLRDGWKTERQFLDEWRIGGIKNETQEKLSKILRYITSGLNTKQIAELMDRAWPTLEEFLENQGFSYAELTVMNKKFFDRRKVLHISDNGNQEVYDLSVKGHENFATNTTIFHNCQIGENGHLFEIICNNRDVKEELEFLFFHPNMLNIDRKLWNMAKNLYVHGDHFIELVIDPEEPKAGILKIQNLPADSVYRIETVKGKLLEFQQSKEGPDYQSLSRVEVTKATPADLAQATALRFTPNQIVHMKIGEDRPQFYPYGVSLIEAARGPAHNLRLIEDSMLVYRLCLKGDTKIWTCNGYKCIKDVDISDKLYSWDNGLIETNVVWHGKTGVKPIYTVASKTKKIEATSNHPFLVKDIDTGKISYISVDNLIPGKHQFTLATQNVEIPKKIDRFYGKVYARLSKEQKYVYRQSSNKNNRIKVVLDKVGLPIEKRNINRVYSFLLHKDNYKVEQCLGEAIAEEFCLGKVTLLNENERQPERINLPEYVDEDFARLFGFLVGDGYVDYQNTSAKLGFAAGEIPEINERYAKLMERYFGKCSFYQDKRCKDGIGNYVVNCYTACKIMDKLGFCGDCYTKRIPDWIFSERKNIRRAFISGLADADGIKRSMVDESSSLTWRTSLRLTNKGLIEDVKVLWESLGLHASHIKTHPSGVVYFNDKEYEQLESWEVYISETPSCEFETIESIEYSGEEDVYDIEVESEHHNFIANGVVVHNSRAPERRIFYIDVGQLPPFKAESFMERMKDLLRKKKAFNTRGQALGPNNPTEERWTPMSVDEDIWVPLRPNSNTRIETLPGATALGEIDDGLYFRNKLFIALNFPKSYMANEDSQITKLSLSSIDVKFARLVERLQMSLSDGMTQIAIRHLELRGFPSNLYEDLQIRLTPPSHYRELSENEVIQVRYDRAMALKGSMLFADIDILTRILKVPADEAKEIVSRAMIQQLQQMKLQIMSQNPQLMGVVMPGQNNMEMGTDSTGPNPQLTGNEQMPGTLPPPEEGQPPQGNFMKKMGDGEVATEKGNEQGGNETQQGVEDTYGKPQQPEGIELPDPTEDDIKRYDLDISDYSKEIDDEEIPFDSLDE